MKKILALVLSLVLLGSMMGSSLAEVDLAAYAPVEGKVYPFTYVTQSGPVNGEGPVVKIVEEEFGVDITFWDAGFGATRTYLGAGDVPDVFAIQLDDMVHFAREGLLAEIPNEVLQKYMPYMYDLWTSISPEMDLWKVDGKNYSLPTMDPEVGGASYPTIFRGDWLEALGYEKAPTTLEEFEKFAYDVVNKDPDGNGVKDTYAISSEGIKLIYGAYGCLPTLFVQLEDGTISHGAIQPQMKEALALLNKWYADGLIAPEFVAGEITSSYLSSDFANGKIAVSTHDLLAWKGATWEGARDGVTYSELKKQNPEAAEKLVWAGPIEGPYGAGNYALHLAKNWMLCFGKQLEDEPDKMARIMQIFEKYSTTVEGWVFARFGVEGTHYDMKPWTYSNGVTVNLPQAKGDFGNWFTIVGEGAGTVFDFFSPMTANAALPERAYLANEQPYLIDLYDQGKCYIDALFVKPACWSDYKNELNLMQSTTYAEIITGERPVDDFDAFVEEWLSYGGQEVLDAVNVNGEGTILPY